MMQDDINISPVIIVGAGRSGTNMLRDALCRLPHVVTWGCDELPSVWRYGQFSRSDDEFTAHDITPKRRHIVRSMFRKLASKNSHATIAIEKTCANSLRLPYVDAALPEARYIQIVRHGYDVVPSAKKRWMGELEVGGFEYFLAKAKHTPPSQLPLYLFEHVRNRLPALFGKRDSLSVWGPRYKGVQNDAGLPLDQICAKQWAACVERSDDFLQTLPAGKALTLKYEDFVADPANQFSRIIDFLGIHANEADITAAIAPVSPRSVGRGRRNKPDTALAQIMASALARHGYKGAD